jgi:DNA-binding PadR family transcriptional regulator
MAAPRVLTELEGIALGIVWSRQPCTPYQVRREFTDSPSTYWSGSAGAIYPLMTRLESAGLLRSVAHATGSRKSRLYNLTPAGRKALVRWVGPPLPPGIVSVPPDPLRMRIAFMTVLPPARRRRFLEEIEKGLREFLEIFERDYNERRVGDPQAELMAHGAVRTQKTRLEWIRGVRRAVEKAASPKPAGKGRSTRSAGSGRRDKLPS